MLTATRVKAAVSIIIQRKNEKNAALRINQKQPRFPLIATFDEIVKELERHVDNVPKLQLESVISDMVKSREVIPIMRGFTLPSVLKNDEKTITEHWSK